ncbi:MAG: TolC family protein [Steroidobacteraceae bacterium]|nr:TolC family protein [Nevskiaceae bacterium]MCP5339598.1 TolC family protein [Nevskiaceae bacterium]MCP5472930.1 TolC family protein [Nevskiaceae bacterium]
MLPCSPRAWIGLRLAAALLLAVGSGSAEVCAQSLTDVVRQVVADHPRVQAAVAGVEASGFALEQARAARLPQFALVADPGRRSLSGEPDAMIGDLGLRGSLLLYDGGRTRETINREQDRVRVARQGLRIAAEELAARVAELYVEWYREEQLAALAAESVAAHVALHDRVREIASFDRGRASDVLQVGARLQQAKLTEALRRAAAAEARMVLAEISGIELGDVQPPADLRGKLPLSLNDALAMLDDHPTLRAAEAEALAARRNARLAAAWMRPRIDLVSALQSPVDPLGQRHHFDELSLRLAASWVPVDGGAGRAGLRAAERQGDQAQQWVRSLRRDLGSRVTGLWAQLEGRRQRLQAHQGLVEHTLQVREAYWQQFTIGRRSVIDLLNAEGEFFQARSAAEDERLGLVQSGFRLLAAGARLTTALGVTVPEVDP